MKIVEIYKLQNDGLQKILATCRLDVSGEVVCEGGGLFVENLIKDGVIDFSIPERNRLFPKDGVRFLEQLQNNFSSGYLMASGIIEKKD